MTKSILTFALTPAEPEPFSLRSIEFFEYKAEGSLEEAGLAPENFLNA